MKALLMKDYWIIGRNCKQMLIVPVLFIILSGASGELVWSLWPVFFISVIPYTVMSYEEQSNWTLYAETMPYGRKMIVYEKYALMLINGLVLTGVLSMIAAVILLVKDEFTVKALWQLVVLYVAGALLPGTMMMPMVFKYGSTKGRTVYLMILVVFGGLMGAMGSVSGDATLTQLLKYGQNFNFTLLLLVVLTLFVLSAAWSVRIYEKREI